jgi:oligopeptide/dipeptide ABC transporter ATP-binding protein
MSEPAATHSVTPGSDSLLRVESLKKHFPVNTGLLGSIRYDPDGAVPITRDESVVRAVDGVSFELASGETFAIVGESGCGKSTLGRTVLGLETPTEGEIWFKGDRVTEFRGESLKTLRRNAQIVFQDPGSSLNPRREIGTIIADPLEAAGWSEQDRRNRVLELLDQVGLERGFYNRYPHEFSGGQRQRINLARALSIYPDLVIADEPVSGLDMSVQAQILNLMDGLQQEYDLTYLLITHDLSVVRHIADRVGVMYLGNFVERASTEVIFNSPHHPYTRALLDTVPNPNPDSRSAETRLSGDVPSPSDPPSGCPFHTRCPELIPPDGFTREAYREFMNFRADVRDRSLEPREEPSDRVMDQSITLEAHFDESLPANARRAVRSAIESVNNGDWDAARKTLSDSDFNSMCESTVPVLESVDDLTVDHESACHLSDDDRAEYKW